MLLDTIFLLKEVWSIVFLNVKFLRHLPPSHRDTVLLILSALIRNNKQKLLT